MSSASTWLSRDGVVCHASDLAAVVDSAASSVVIAAADRRGIGAVVASLDRPL
jgi:hypothetical protein